MLFLVPETVLLYPNKIWMRLLFLSIILASCGTLTAQTQVSPSVMNYSQREFPNTLNALGDSTTQRKKWSLYKYGGISASYGFMNSGSYSAFSAPIGLQLNRRITNNVYAFAGISAAPAFFNFNQSFSNSSIYKNAMGGSGINANAFGMYTKFEAGLMYVNDARTFSISGSIGVSKTNFPYYTGDRNNAPQPQPIGASRQKQ